MCLDTLKEANTTLIPLNWISGVDYIKYRVYNTMCIVKLNEKNHNGKVVLTFHKKELS